jgi:hypothetical protein
MFCKSALMSPLRLRDALLGGMQLRMLLSQRSVQEPNHENSRRQPM